MADEEGFTRRVTCKDCNGDGQVPDDFAPDFSVTYDPEDGDNAG
jgi:DnaJ-class molecular chaperone